MHKSAKFCIPQVFLEPIQNLASGRSSNQEAAYLETLLYYLLGLENSTLALKYPISHAVKKLVVNKG